MIRLPSSSVDAYKHSFYVGSIPAWNALSVDVVNSAPYPEFIQRVSTTLITLFIFIPCNSIPCKCFIVISYHVFERPLAAPLPD